ncbi:MAG: cytochrome c biogenesis protein ResB [Planctomycetota bacterium]
MRKRGTLSFLQDALFPSVLRALRSVKLAVIVLLALILASVAGTLVVQGADAQTYAQLYGPGAATVLTATGLADVFTSWWFLALTGWLAASMFCCSVVRLPRILRSIRSHRALREESAYERTQYHKAWSCPAGGDLTVEALAERAVSALRARRYRLAERLSDDGRTCLSARKHAAGRLGPFLVHLSLIVIVIGGAWTALGKFTTSVNVAIGESVPLAGTPYFVKLRDFTVELYAGTDQPSEYISHLTMMQDGRDVGQGQVKVNQPLTLEGYSFYQMRYLPTASDVTLEVTRKADGRAMGEFTLPMDRKTPVEALGATLEARDFLPHFAITSDKAVVSRTPKYINPAVQLTVHSGGKAQSTTWVFQDAGDVHGSSKGDYRYNLKQYTPTTRSGMKVVRDPAVYVVYGGFTVLLVGTFLSCYAFHRRAWVMVRRSEGRVVMHLAGQCARDVLGFRSEMDKLFEQILPQGQEEVK